MARQSQKYLDESVYPVTLRHAFSTAVAPTVVAAGSFPSAGSKIALSTAESQKVMGPIGGTSLTSGDISLDDTNDRILLEPGVYEVEVGLMLTAAGTDSDFGVALTAAAAATPDVEYDDVNGAVVPATESVSFNTKQLITVTAARALELHVAWHTAGQTGTLKKGSFISVKRLGNVE